MGDTLDIALGGIFMLLGITSFVYFIVRLCGYGEDI
jgi:hypothetical protein